MRFSFLYAFLVSLLLLGEPFVLRTDWSSPGTWFWFGLGVVGMVGSIVERGRKKT